MQNEKRDTMKLLLDADGCPVVDIAVCLAKKYRVECIILCDTSHLFERDGARTITVSKGTDSVDFTLVNLVEKGDVIITQDYGLAAMCLAREGITVSQNGMIYNQNNIDSLLMQRHTAKKIRMEGGRAKAIPKRTKQQDEEFTKVLSTILEKKEGKNSV